MISFSLFGVVKPSRLAGALVCASAATFKLVYAKAKCEAKSKGRKWSLFGAKQIATATV
jgi:hypothetical protein